MCFIWMRDCLCNKGEVCVVLFWCGGNVFYFGLCYFVFVGCGMSLLRLKLGGGVLLMRVRNFLWCWISNW